MFFRDLTSRGTTPVLEAMMAFTEARHRVLTENIANIDTPGYRTKHLDPAAFQKSLREAVNSRRERGGAEFHFRGSDQVQFDTAGRIQVTPSEEPAENLLFHDGTNTRVERQMAMLAENAMMHQAMTEMLRKKYEGLLKAITGRVG